MSTPDCIIILDKKTLQMAGINVDELKHPANYSFTNRVTTTPSTINNGNITNDFNFSLGKYITIYIKQGDRFSILKNDIDTDVYTYNCNSLEIHFTVPENDSYKYNDSTNKQFIIPDTNKTVKFVYDNNATITSPSTTQNYYKLTADSGIVDIVLITPKTDNSHINKYLSDTLDDEPLDKHMNSVNNIISDVLVDIFIIILGWLIIINLTTNWMSKPADEMYPILPENSLYCSSGSSVLNFNRTYDTHKFNTNDTNNKPNQNVSCDKTEYTGYNSFSIFKNFFNSFRNDIIKENKNKETEEIEENITYWDLFAFDRNYTATKIIHLVYKILNFFHFYLNNLYKSFRLPNDFFKNILFIGLLFAYYYSIRPNNEITSKYVNINNFRDMISQKLMYSLINFFYIFAILFILILVFGWGVNIYELIYVGWNETDKFMKVIYFFIVLALIFSLPYLFTFLGSLISKVYKNKLDNFSNELLKPSNMYILIFIVFLFQIISISSIFTFGTLFNLLNPSTIIKNMLEDDKYNKSLKYYIYSFFITISIILLMRFYEFDKKILFPILIIILIFVGFNLYNI